MGCGKPDEKKFFPDEEKADAYQGENWHRLYTTGRSPKTFEDPISDFKPGRVIMGNNPSVVQRAYCPFCEETYKSTRVIELTLLSMEPWLKAIPAGLVIIIILLFVGLF